MRSKARVCRRAMLALLGSATLSFSLPATAQIVLSEVIVDLDQKRGGAADIEVLNEGEQRTYVGIEPFEIFNAGTPQQQRQPLANPREAAVLVTPRKIVLEPGERKTIRIALLGPRPASDRVLRVTIKPVAGELVTNADALKLLIGYDTLVFVRADAIRGSIDAVREDGKAIITNNSNTAYELSQGKACPADVETSSTNKECADLPGTRLYPGVTWSVDLSPQESGRYLVTAPGTRSELRF